VMTALRALRANLAAERLAVGAGYPDTGLVAVNSDGTRLRPETYSKMFDRHCRAAGVPSIRLHDTRHTAATRMLDSGTTVAATAKWLGHDPAMTLRVYGHAYDDALASAGDMCCSARRRPARADRLAHRWHTRSAVRTRWHNGGLGSGSGAVQFGRLPQSMIVGAEGFEPPTAGV